MPGLISNNCLQGHMSRNGRVSSKRTARKCGAVLRVRFGISKQNDAGKGLQAHC